jgi:hypothetical protein
MVLYVMTLATVTTSIKLTGLFEWFSKPSETWIPTLRTWFDLFLSQMIGKIFVIRARPSDDESPNYELAFVQSGIYIEEDTTRDSLLHLRFSERGNSWDHVRDFFGMLLYPLPGDIWSQTELDDMAASSQGDVIQDQKVMDRNEKTFTNVFDGKYFIVFSQGVGGQQTTHTEAYFKALPYTGRKTFLEILNSLGGFFESTRGVNHLFPRSRTSSSLAIMQGRRKRPAAAERPIASTSSATAAASNNANFEPTFGRGACRRPPPTFPRDSNQEVSDFRFYVINPLTVASSTTEEARSYERLFKKAWLARTHGVRSLNHLPETAKWFWRRMRNPNNITNLVDIAMSPDMIKISLDKLDLFYEKTPVGPTCMMTDGERLQLARVNSLFMVYRQTRFTSNPF